MLESEAGSRPFLIRTCEEFREFSEYGDKACSFLFSGDHSRSGRDNEIIVAKLKKVMVFLEELIQRVAAPLAPIAADFQDNAFPSPLRFGDSLFDILGRVAPGVEYVYRNIAGRRHGDRRLRIGGL